MNAAVDRPGCRARPSTRTLPARDPAPTPTRPWRRAVGLAAALAIGGCAWAPPAATPPAPAADLGRPDRVAAWQADLDVARDRFLAADRSYAIGTRAQAHERLAALRRGVGGRDDVAIAAELARIAALSGNAHTRAYLLRNRGHWRRYPLRIWHFAEGWRVIAAQGEAAALVGGRLTHIDGRLVDDLTARLRPLYAGNDSWSEYMATYTLTSPEALSTAGAGDADGRAEFRVERDGAVRTVRVAPLPHAPRPGPEESHWYLSPQHPAVQGWVHALDTQDAAGALPEWLRRPAAFYRDRRCAGGVLYLRFARAEDEAGSPTVAEWGRRVLDGLRSDPPAQLVLDLRNNTGGDLQKAQPFIEALAASYRARTPRRLVVLAGVATFSAGITPLATLRSRGAATLVGRAPGDAPDFWAEGGNVVLPHSGLVLHYADGLHAYSDRPVPPGIDEYLALGIDVRDLQPDQTVDLAWSDYLAGRDPVLAAATGDARACAP